MTQPTQELRSIGLAEARTMLLAADNIVLTTHMSPDGDALGSEGGLYYYLLDKGKAIRIINCHPVPPNLAILGEDEIFETYEPTRHDAVLASANIIAVLDVNAASRLESMEAAVRASQAQKLVIDHHTNPQPFADAYCIDTEISATGELVYDLITGDTASMIDTGTARHLYIAIMTDTGSFRFERTTPKVHRIVASLLDTGLIPSEIHERVFDSFPMNRTKLLGMALQSIHPVCDGKATLLTITHAMLAATGTTNDDTEGMVNYGLGIDGVQATAMITELDDAVKISFRSRGKARVNEIAQQFGGGGHANAAAARIHDGKVEEIRASVEAALCELFG